MQKYKHYILKLAHRNPEKQKHRLNTHIYLSGNSNYITLIFILPLQQSLLLFS